MTDEPVGLTHVRLVDDERWEKLDETGRDRLRQESLNVVRKDLLADIKEQGVLLLDTVVVSWVRHEGWSGWAAEASTVTVPRA